MVQPKDSDIATREVLWARRSVHVLHFMGSSCTQKGDHRRGPEA